MTRWFGILFCALLAPATAVADGIMLVEAGAFWMGRDDGPAEEAPRHRVYVRDFWLERHKVTNAEFALFLNAAGPSGADGRSRYDADDPDARIHRSGARWTADPGFESHPAVEVSWFGARDYCAWRGRRLPTETEWEKAARGDDGRLHPWGDAPADPTRAILGQPYGGTAPAGGREAGGSPSGVMDLLGNLREWTASIFRPYPYRDDPERGPFTGAGRVVLRGASHDDAVAGATVTARHTYDARGAAAGHHHVGWRCATSEDLGERYTR